MPNRLQRVIGAVKDQTSISLAKVNYSSSNLQVAVLKATTHDDLPIDERYVNEILNLISFNKIYAAASARAICRRISRTRNWIVTLKSLMLVLRIFQDGDPYFPKEILHAIKEDSRRLLKLSNFCDHLSSNSWHYTGFVRTFGLYLEERLDCFLRGKLQRRYTYKKKGSNHFRKKTNDVVCEMRPTMLIDRIVCWQRLLQRAIATRPTGVAKQNHLVKISVYAVVRESFDLYRDISDGLALLLNNFSELQYQSRVNIFEICVKAEKQFEELHEFYYVCKNIGVGRISEYPEVQIFSGELIQTLQEYLKDNVHSHTPRKVFVIQGTGLLSRRHESYGEQSDFSGFSSSTQRDSYKSSESGEECKSLEDVISTPEAHNGESEERLQHEKTIVDLISFDDWLDNEEKKKNTKQNNLDDLFKQKESGPNDDCELVLAQTPTHQQSTYQTDILSNTLNASSQPQFPPINPFLQDLHDINSRTTPGFEASFSGKDRF